MKCPVCELTLSISTREGIEIDYCPQCRGVWLDRGELDKIIERAAPMLAGGPGAPPPPPPPPAYDRDRDHDRDHDRARPRSDDRYRDDDRDDRRPRRKRRGSFLEDLFDFD